MNILKQLSDYCKEEQVKCEETTNSWFHNDKKVNISTKTDDSEYIFCEKEDGTQFWAAKDDLENRKHLDTSRYNAFADVLNKIEELKKKQ